SSPRQQQRRVRDTNESSAASKGSAAALGYTRDRFLSALLPRSSRRAPLIHRLPCPARLRRCLVPQGAGGRAGSISLVFSAQILSLGAGFDSLYFRLKELGLLGCTVVYEVDFPDVVRRKAALIEELDLSVPQSHGEPCLAGEDYKLLGVDLSDLSRLEESLKQAGLDPEAPTLLLAEVVLTYMENSRSDALIQWAASSFSRAQFVLYEQIHPEDPFGRVMLQHFSRRNSRLHSLSCYPDCQAQRSRFLQRGWEECSVLDMNEFYSRYISADEHHRIQTLEPFDEYEVICLGGAGCTHHLPDFDFIWLAAFPVNPAPQVAGIISASACSVDAETAGLRRYGHRSALIKPHMILTTGGFGEHDGQHRRLHELHLLIKHQGMWRAGSVHLEEPGDTWGMSWDGRLFHTMTCLSGNQALVMGGRTSPVNPALRMLQLRFAESRQISAMGRAAVVELAVLRHVENPTGPRWRHTATEVRHQGQMFLFIYGGRSAVQPVLGDWHFLHLEELSCVQIPVEGPLPVGRHSHSACSWDGGVLLAGGLGAAEQPVGSVLFLRPTERGFRWQTVETQPSLLPRYSHTAHVHDGKLLLVGGVWLHSPSVPGVTVIDLATGLCLEYQIDTVSWPLMLHNHSSVFLPDEKELLLVGGGGNCFSFGTHFNQRPVCLDLGSILAGH
uniref:tRNA wybutosine-synthesizing protein 4 n=1 Tax=Sphenodon punctatus TaxID=8508 RepID=A0A8D0GZC6_SPHPU